MECHNERAARSRRHHEKKKRAKAKLEEEQRRELATQVCSLLTRVTYFPSNSLSPATRTGYWSICTV